MDEMKDWNCPVMKFPIFFRIATGGVLLAIQACAPSHPFGNGREPTMADWTRLEDELRRDTIEGKNFDEQHQLQGKLVSAAARELIADGYRCEVGLLDTVRTAPGEPDFVPAKKALLFCERKSSDPGDFCAERFVRLDATWPDVRVGLSVLTKQADEVVVTHTTFRCDTPSDVAIRLRKRQDGRQE